MSDIITFSDRKPSGNFAQIRLDDGKRILVSFTQTEIAILKLVLGGSIPTGKIFKHDISEFLDFFCVRVEQIGINGSLLEAVVHYILPCKNIEEVVKKMGTVVEGYDNPAIKAGIQQKLQKKVHKLFKKSFVQDFESFSDHAFLEIQEMAKIGKITKFEEKAFISFCAAANIAAKTYITTDKLPYIKIEEVENENTTFDAYLFLCAVELHGFFTRLKNKKEIKDALDVSQEKLVKNFAEIFGGKELEDHLKKLLNTFNKMVEEMGDDPRDLWYNQALLFGNKLSEGKINFGALTEKDLAVKMSISTISTNLQIESAKIFDSIVFGKKK